MRIFDDPNHPQYGPVRRMWVILVQLNLLSVADRLFPYSVQSWDVLLAFDILTGKEESRAQCAMLADILEGRP